MDMYAWTVVLTLLLYFVMGVILSRWIKKLDDYYVAGRAMPGVCIAGSFMAAWTSMVGLVGAAGMAWVWGMGNYLLLYGSFWGIVLFTAVFAIPLRRGEFLTVPDFFHGLFQSRRVRIISVIILIFAMAGYCIAQCVAAGVIMEGLSGIPYAYGMWLFTISIAIYVLFGGMMAVVITDTVMFFSFCLCALALPYTLAHFGGWEFLMVKLPALKPGLWKVSGFQAGAAGPGATFWWGASISYFAMTAVSPHLLSRAYTAKNEKSLLQGMSWGFPFVMIMLICYGTAFMFINSQVLQPGGPIPKTDYAAGYLLKNMLPGWIAVIVLSGIMAAGISTANVCLLVLAQGIGRDIYQKLINPDVDDKKLILITRIIVGISGLAIALISQFKFPWVLGIATWAIGSVAPTFLPIGLAGLFWRRLTEKATYWAMVWGFIVYAALIFCEKEFFPKTFFKVMILPSLVWGMIVAAILIIIISYKTTNPPEQQKIWDDLHAKMFPKERAHATAANYVWTLTPAIIFVVFLIWYLAKVLGT